MSTLNFPTNPYIGQQYNAPNGVTYAWDGTKWNVASKSATGNITFNNNTISTNNLGNVYIDLNCHQWEFNTTGNLVLPQGGTINYYCGSNALVGGGPGPHPGGKVSWYDITCKNGPCGPTQIALGMCAGNINQATNTVAIGSFAGSINQGNFAVAIGTNAGTTCQADNSIIINATGCPITTCQPGLYISPLNYYPGCVILFPVGYNFETGEVFVGAGYGGGGCCLLRNGCYIFKLNSCGTVSMPCNTQLNSGGIDARNAAALVLTTCRPCGSCGPIAASSINLSAGNGGVGITVVGPYTGGACGSGGPSIVTVGTENVSGANGPGFAGLVASDPTVTTPYNLGLGGNNIIEIGFATCCGVLTSDGYTLGLGVLNGNKTVNGLFVNGNTTVLNGGNTTPAIVSMTDTGISLNTNSACTPLPTTNWWWNVWGDLAASNNINFGTGVVHDSGGNVFVVGAIGDNSSGGLPSSMLLKYNQQGTLLYHKRWVDEYGGPPCVYNQTIDIDSRGTLWFLADNTTLGFYVGSFSGKTGIIDQQYAYGVADIVGLDMSVDDHGNQYVTGNYNDNSLVVTKVHAGNGAMEWNTVTNALTASNGFAITTDTGGNVYVGGNYQDGESVSAAVWKFNNDGQYLWTKKVYQGNVSTNIAVDGVEINDGNLYVLINEYDSEAIAVAKLDLEVTTAAWSRKIALGSTPQGYDLNFDNRGSIYVTGTFNDVPAGGNFYMAKFATDSGNLIWENGFGTLFAPGESIATGARTASVHNDLLVLTGLTYTDPLTGNLDSAPKVITFQLPTDNSLPAGKYGPFTLYPADYVAVDPAVITPVDVTNLFVFSSQTLTDHPSALNPLPLDYEQGYTNYNYDMMPPQSVVTITTGNAIAGGGTWTFDGRGSLTFPDATRQFSAYEVINIDMDGGGASTIYEVTTAYAEGGTAANRFGPNDTIFNGGNAATAYGPGATTINGGGA